MKKFHYSSYWHTWSRNLAQENGIFVELDLTPVNGFDRGNVAEIRQQTIRSHSTRREKRDIDTDELPVDVVLKMHKYIDDGELVNRLLTFDYMSELTVEQIESKMRGGGVPFYILKGMPKFEPSA